MICGTAVIAGPLRIGGNAVIGDAADISESNHVELHVMSWGEPITLYRCEDGTVGLGRSVTDHGPLWSHRPKLLDLALGRRVADLTELWAVPALAARE